MAAQQRGVIRQANKAITNAAGSIGRRAGQMIGNAVAPIIGGMAGGAIGNFIGKNAYRLTQAFGTFLVAQAIAGFAMAIVAAAILTIFVSFAMFVINSGAYVVPPGANLVGTSTVISQECLNSSQPKPVLGASDVRFSSDGRYAFPIAPFNMTRNACYHWDGELAVDIFVSQSPGGPDVVTGGYRPVVAYTSGTIETAGIDSVGGRIIVLRGNDNRFYYYAHNCALYVTTGQQVNVGEVIATTDTTGSAATTSSPIEHLHFAMGTASFFSGGGGTVCPSWDFDQKFGLNRCPTATQISCPLPVLPVQ